MCIPGQRAALVQATFWGLQLLPSCGSAIFNEPPRPVCLSAWKVAHERFFQAQICLGVVLPLYSLSMGLYFYYKGDHETWWDCDHRKETEQMMQALGAMLQSLGFIPRALRKAKRECTCGKSITTSSPT